MELRYHQGMFLVLLDQEDEDLESLNWRIVQKKKSFYVERTIEDTRRKESLHRVVLERKLNRSLTRHEHTDHRDRNTMNNRRENLRSSTPGQNHANTLGTARDLPHGVYRRKNRFTSTISVNGRSEYLGYFQTVEEARRVFERRHIEIHGEFSPYFDSGEVY